MKTNKSEDQFIAALQQLAIEQQRLTETTLLPSWLGPVNRLIATHALVLLIVASGIVSTIVFLIWFPFFFTLGRQLV